MFTFESTENLNINKLTNYSSTKIELPLNVPYLNNNDVMLELTTTGNHWIATHAKIKKISSVPKYIHS